MASEIGTPLFKRPTKVGYRIPALLDHSAMDKVIPSWVYFLVSDLLFICSCHVAHLQFPGKYPRELSIRSSVIPSGGSPISERKFLKSSHRSQIVTCL